MVENVKVQKQDDNNQMITLQVSVQLQFQIHS
jgi:hypothetical protein